MGFPFFQCFHSQGRRFSYCPFGLLFLAEAKKRGTLCSKPHRGQWIGRPVEMLCGVSRSPSIAKRWSYQVTKYVQLNQFSTCLAPGF